MTVPAINRAAVFDVQSFSIHDGPGIRTTVFFKGCPMDCLWCHNPESKSPSPQLMYQKNLCAGCLLCVKVCEQGAQFILPDGSHGLRREACTVCGKCLEVCCYGALSLSGSFYTPEELLEKIRGDFRYFSLGKKEGKPEGGITFSGGEPLLHAGFIRDFCRLVPGIHRAVETSGHGTKESVEKLLDCIDLYLFDLKIINREKHKKWCGFDNALILDNLDFLYAKKKRIILRLPLIPGINDDQEQFDGIAKILRRYPEIEGAEILPYHSYGTGKAEALGLPVSPELPARGASRGLADQWLEAFRTRGCARVSFS
jgi:pyruvate formate lyase activating enzyme